MSSPGLVLILLDGLRLSTARQCMCWLRALELTGAARFLPLRAELPPLSRPVYATLLTGLAPVAHDVLGNDFTAEAELATVFGKLAARGQYVAAAAYSWIFELCQGLEYEPKRHRFWQSAQGPIHYGIFYAEDDYPDSAVFADAEALRRRHEPQLLFLHTMGIDYAGHLYGGASRQYRQAAARADALLASYLPAWLAAGCGAMILADHGMGEDGDHYSLEDAVLDVPLWLIGDFPVCEEIRQTDIAGMIEAWFAQA